MVGVAAATTERGTLVTAGTAGVVAGAISMALGEYVSVSTQRDTERALLAEERRELTEQPDQEFAELTALYEARGLSADTARTVAEELTEHDVFAAHVDIELGIDPDALTDPWRAAASSAVAFVSGALLPLLSIMLSPAALRMPVTFVVVLSALALTGALSATLGGAPIRPALLRIVFGGMLAMIVTYGVGQAAGIIGL